MTWLHMGRKDAFDCLVVNKNSKDDVSKFIPTELNMTNFSSKGIKITRQALLMLSSLNDYDQKKVVKEIYFVTKHPSAHSSLKHSSVPGLRLYKTKYPFRSYHYLITYFTNSDGSVVVHDINFDNALLGKKLDARQQRPMLYHVNKIGKKTYTGKEIDAEVKDIMRQWEVQGPVTNINTTHAAVNGMQNNYQKAVGLMGIHVDVAYEKDKLTEYTLFHNPTDGAIHDLIECAFDKSKGRVGYNAQQLSAVMVQSSRQGKQVKWVVHSQGGIIFAAALKLIGKQYGIVDLSKQEVVIHASGVHPNVIKERASKFGLRVHEDKTRINPFDMVPQVAAGVSRSRSSLVNCAKFAMIVCKSDDMTASPHTLPYRGMQNYLYQLKNSNCPRLNPKHYKAVYKHLLGNPDV